MAGILLVRSCNVSRQPYVKFPCIMTAVSWGRIQVTGESLRAASTFWFDINLK